MTTARAFRGYRFPAAVFLWAVAVPAVPDRSRGLERMLADRGSRSTTPPCPAGSSASPPSSRAHAPASPPCHGQWHVDETYLRVEVSHTISIAPSTAPARPSTSCSAPSATSRRPSASSARARPGRRPPPAQIVTDRLKATPARSGSEAGRRAVALHRHRRQQWLDDLVEQDHRRIERRTGRCSVSELWDRAADAGRRRGDGDAGQGTGACRARQRHAGAAGPVHQSFGLTV